MLVLTRKTNQTIEIDGGITITVLRHDESHVRLGLDAPPQVGVRRGDAKRGPKRTAPRSELCYLASPYTAANKQVEFRRFRAGCMWAATLCRAGLRVFSPIAHSHPIAVQSSLATDFAAWRRWNLDLLRRCDRLIVLELSGWAESEGVAAEIAEAERIGLPISHLHTSGLPSVQVHGLLIRIREERGSDYASTG